MTDLSELKSPYSVTKRNTNICAIDAKFSDCSCTEPGQQPLEGNAQETVRSEVIRETDLVGDNAGSRQMPWCHARSLTKTSRPRCSRYLREMPRLARPPTPTSDVLTLILRTSTIDVATPSRAGICERCLGFDLPNISGRWTTSESLLYCTFLLKMRPHILYKCCSSSQH